MATTPQDVLPDGAEGAEFHGEYVRKGTIAAFIANAKLLQSLPVGTPEYQDAATQLRTLKPALDAVDLFDVVTIRDPAVVTLLSGQPPDG
ncbi:MAG: hypothetical protein ABIQ18_14115 [Umezawaea sp.]